MKRYITFLSLLPILFLTACSNSKYKVMPRSYYCDNDPTRPKYLGDCGDGSGAGEVVTSSSNGSSFYILFLIILIFLSVAYYFFLRWVWNVAIRNHRSAWGFVWMGVFTPYLAWVILLIIDKRKIMTEIE